MQAVCPLSRAVSPGRERGLLAGLCPRGCCVLRRLVLPAVGSERACSYVRFLLFRPGGGRWVPAVCVPRVWLCPPSVAVCPGIVAHPERSSPSGPSVGGGL